MSRGPSDIKLTNIRRIIAGAEKAGVVVGRIEVAKNGTVSIIPRGEQDTVRPDSSNEWDEALNRPAKVPG